MITSIPNLLTISRVVAIPVIVALFYVEGREWQWLACVIFSMAAITDYLDGYFARVWREQSAFGRFLDPVADKLLVARISGLSVIPALIILCREILVSGLREFLASLQVSLPVSRLAKWKTTIQMVALGFLIVGNSGPGWIPVETIGDIGLWTAAILTLITGWDYLRASARYVTPGAEPPPSGGVPRPAAEGAGQR